jgi:hypothetical protein
MEAETQERYKTLNTEKNEERETELRDDMKRTKIEHPPRFRSRNEEWRHKSGGERRVYSLDLDLDYSTKGAGASDAHLDRWILH